MMLYSYLSTFIFAFLNDTSQKTRTVLNQEINIRSLKEAKPKKKLSPIHVHIQMWLWMYLLPLNCTIKHG